MRTEISIFHKLPGTWSFARTINNFNHDSLSGDARGHANFNRIDNNLIYYREEGIFTINTGSKLRIFQEYFFALNHLDAIQKYSACNGIKGSLLLDSLHHAAHQCGRDLYEATYVFNDASFQEFALTYEVFGPSKNYRSTTKYTLET